MEIYDKSESMDIVIYKFDIGYRTLLAKVEISTKKLIAIKDFEKFINDLPNELFVGEHDYNTALKKLKEIKIIA